MANMNEHLIRQRLNDDLQYLTEQGYKVLGVFLQGSQNYNLDYEGSDIDTKAIVLPSFNDIVLNRKPVSTTIVLPSNEHIDVKDIRLMFECFKKQNINFLEILFTDFYVVNSLYYAEWLRMVENAEDIAHYHNYRAVNCIAGMVFEKCKALCHPYPSLKDKIDKYGYDNKQLHHIIRCEEFLRRWVAGESYCDCLIPTDPEYLVKVKSSYIYRLETAKEIADKLEKNTKKVLDAYRDNTPVIVNTDVEELMNDVLCNILKTAIWEDISV
jgi:predicted nucleotidyltransferase